MTADVLEKEKLHVVLCSNVTRIIIHISPQKEYYIANSYRGHGHWPLTGNKA